MSHHVKHASPWARPPQLAMPTLVSTRAVVTSEHVSTSTPRARGAASRVTVAHASSFSRNACASSLALLVTFTQPNVAFAAPAAPSYSGVDPSRSSFIQGLVEKSEKDKAKNDQARLDNFYRRDYRINRIVGGEVLKEPCDPRDPEFGYECRPMLPRLPQDRDGFDEPLEREKTGYGKVLGVRDVDRAADALVAAEVDETLERAIETIDGESVANGDAVARFDSETEASPSVKASSE